MCGGCPRCGEPIYGLIQHSPENCINALKGSRDSAREGREMVRGSGRRDLNAVATAIEDVAGRLSLAGSPEDLEKAVNDLLTISGNARRGVLT